VSAVDRELQLSAFDAIAIQLESYFFKDRIFTQGMPNIWSSIQSLQDSATVLPERKFVINFSMTSDNL